MADIVRVEGLQQLGQALSRMRTDMALKIAGRATAAGAGVVKPKAKANLVASPSVITGLLLKNVILKKVPKSQTDLTSAHIVTVKKQTYPGDPKRNTRSAGRFLEFGTVKETPEPWLGPALDNNRSQATNAIKNKLKAGIDASAKAGKA